MRVAFQGFRAGTRRIGAVALCLLSAAPAAQGVDCDGDGVPDTLEQAAGTYGFAPPERFELRGDVVEVTTADFDGDLDLDLAAAPRGADSVVVLRNGFEGRTGSFAPGVEHAMGSSPARITAGDFNGDGRMDLAAAADSGEVFLLAGDGAGGRAPPVSLAAPLDPGCAPLDLEAGDLDGDGVSDLMYITTYCGAVLLRSAVGFQPLVLDIQALEGLAVADLDGDGDADLALSSRSQGELGGHQVLMLRNRGDGAFDAPDAYLATPDAGRLASGDLDGDGDQDLVVQRIIQQRAADELRVLINHGNGTFSPARTLILNPAGDGFAFFALGDLDGDHDADLLILPADRSARVYPNRGDGSFDAPALVATGALPLHAVIADLDGDGLNDLATAGAGAQVSVILTRLGTASPDLDLNQNGIPDECENLPVSFRIAFDAPIEAPADPGATGRAEAKVLLHTRGLSPGDFGAQGWAFFVTSRGCKTIAATTDGTAAADTRDGPPGLRDNGFEHTEVTGACPRGFNGAITSVVLSLRQPVTLDPGTSPHSVLRLTLEGSSSPDGDCSECVLGLIDVDDCNSSHTGQPIENTVTWNALGLSPTCTPRSVRFCLPRFHRADANSDGKLDISDPITVLGSLFLGLPPPACLDAADSQNDGRLDISDAIHALGYLFGGGALPEPPGPPAPGACGIDPAEPPDSLGCQRYEACLPEA